MNSYHGPSSMKKSGKDPFQELKQTQLAKKGPVRHMDQEPLAPEPVRDNASEVWIGVVVLPIDGVTDVYGRPRAGQAGWKSGAWYPPAR